MKLFKLLIVVSVFLLGVVKLNAQCGPLVSPDLSSNGHNGIMFDVVSLNPVIITQIEMELPAGTHSLEIYTRPGTHVGFQNAAAGWILAGTAVGVVGGAGVHTTIPIITNEFICPGNRTAFYVTITTGASVTYSNGTGVGNVHVADANIQILEGTGKAYPFGASFQPRVPRATIHYTCPPPAGPPANAGPDQTICSTTAVLSASSGGVWTIVSGAGTFSNLNDPNATVTGLSVGLNQFQWSTACPTTTDIVDITVTTPPSVTVPSNATYCNGDLVPIGTFTSAPAGGTFTWTNSNTAIGLAASGSGNAPAFTATNATGSTISGTITVTPTVSGCVGTSSNYTITVNPTSTVTVPSNATYCNGDLVPVGTFTSAPAGGTFTWTNSNTAIGLAASGSGNAPAFTATNATGSTISGTITVTPTLNGCVGASSNYTITINPIPTAPTASSVTICPNNFATLIATAPGGTYEWYDAATAGTLLSTGASYTTPVLVSNTSYWVQTTVNGCISPRTMVTVTIAAAISVNAGLDDTICAGQSYPLSVSPNGAGYSYIWDEPANLGFSTIFNPSVSPAATTTYTITVTDPSNCVGTDMVTITVNPVPTVTVPANATYCNGDLVPIGTFNSTPAGGTISWANSDPTIGLAASGTGNAPAFTATNTTGAPVTATITVTPTLNGCVGASSNYTITINPTPAVTVPAGATYCNGDAVPLGAFISTPMGGTFSWTNSDPTIGLAASGTGNVPAFTATNSTSTPITATISVIPTANGCVGASVNYTITVNPTPTATVPVNIAYCNGDPVPIGTFNSTPSGGAFSWINSDPTIGLATSGTGNVPSFNAINATSTAIVATITVIPEVNGCFGAPLNYTITVNPGAMANVGANISACPGDLIPASAFTSVPAGGTFAWSNSNPSIGLGASGVNNTLSFTATNATGSPAASTISVIATANGCPGIASTYNVTVNPVVTGITNTSICQGDSIILGGAYVSSAGSYIDTLTSTFGCDSILTTNLSINVVTVDTTQVVVCDGDSVLIEDNYYDTTGTFPFTYVSSFGCDSTIVYNITIASLPSFNITGGASINLGESASLAVMPGVAGTTYSWDPPTGLSCIFCQNPTSSPLESTWYYVAVTNAATCSWVDSVYIEVDPSTNIYVPNIFSPNGDGNNDVYFVGGKGVDQFNLAVFNRWGQLVFESNDIEQGWDGTKNGNLLNQGVFVYKLHITFYDGDTFKQTGNITLVR